MEKTSYITSVADLFVPKKAGSISLATTLIFAVLLFIRSLLVLYNINRIRKRCSSEGSETSGGHTESYGFGKRNLRRKKLRRLQPVKTLVVFGSGGHTTEMLSMIRHLPPTRYSPLVHVVANTDTTSIERIRTAAADGKSRLPNVTYRIPRSREVGQSYLTSIGTTMYSFVYAWCIVFRVRPDLVLCNGPGTCLPLAYCTFISRMLGLCRGNIVFVESFCRVLSLSLTGKFLYPIVDRFIVHWEELQNEYSWTERIGTFVPLDALSMSPNDDKESTEAASAKKML